VFAQKIVSLELLEAEPGPTGGVDLDRAGDALVCGPSNALACPGVGSGARSRSSTNTRIAEERLLCWRDSSISATIFDSVTHWACAISFRPRQNASSRLMLVLCPPMTMERFDDCGFHERALLLAIGQIWHR
jgi:hypothetical protein